MQLTGNAAACYVTRLFEEFGGAEMPKEKEKVVKETSAVLYAGKSVQTVPSCCGQNRLTFFVAGTDSVRATPFYLLFVFALCLQQTYSIFCSFFLACTLHPEVHKAAREEIDRVVGRDRLPTFDDRPSLPYLDALVKEVLRWNPAAPLGETFHRRISRPTS